MVSDAAVVAGSALVFVRLDLGTRTTGAHSARRGSIDTANYGQWLYTCGRAAPACGPGRAQRWGHRGTAADGAAGALQVRGALRTSQERPADSRRSGAGSSLGLPVQELRAEGLGDVRGGLRAAAAARQVRCGRD